MYRGVDRFFASATADKLIWGCAWAVDGAGALRVQFVESGKAAEEKILRGSLKAAPDGVEQPILGSDLFQLPSKRYSCVAMKCELQDRESFSSLFTYAFDLIGMTTG